MKSADTILFLALAGLSSLAVLPSCGSNQACTTGQQNLCLCLDGTSGSQTCRPDGSGYGSCGPCGSNQACTPGQQNLCLCLDGTSGSQTCRSDGSGYGSCGPCCGDNGETLCHGRCQSCDVGETGHCDSTQDTIVCCPANSVFCDSQQAGAACGAVCYGPITGPTPSCPTATVCDGNCVVCAVGQTVICSTGKCQSGGTGSGSGGSGGSSGGSTSSGGSSGGSSGACTCSCVCSTCSTNVTCPAGNSRCRPCSAGCADSCGLVGCGSAVSSNGDCS